MYSNKKKVWTTPSGSHLPRFSLERNVEKVERVTTGNTHRLFFSLFVARINGERSGVGGKKSELFLVLLSGHENWGLHVHCVALTALTLPCFIGCLLLDVQDSFGDGVSKIGEWWWREG